MYNHQNNHLVENSYVTVMVKKAASDPPNNINSLNGDANNAIKFKYKI